MASGLQSAAQYDSHAPIKLDDGSDLLLPDAASSNGVRSGLGTQGNPFVISDWRIAYDTPQGILIQNIASYLLLDRLDIAHQGGNEPSTGIRIQNSPHVEIRNVLLHGMNTAIWTADSNVILSNISMYDLVTVGTSETQRPWLPDSMGFLASGGNVTWNGGIIQHADQGFLADAENVQVDKLSFKDVREGLRAAFGGRAHGSIRVSNLSVHGRAVDGEIGGCSGATFVGGLARGVAISVDPRSLTAFEVRDSQVDGFGLGVGIGPSLPDGSETVGSGMVANNVIRHTACGLVSGTPGARVRIEGNTIMNNAQGVGLFVEVNKVAIDTEVLHNRIAVNDVGVRLEHAIQPRTDAQHPAKPNDDDRAYEYAQAARSFVTRLHGNDIVNNKDFGLVHDASNARAAPIDATDNFWGSSGPRLSTKPGLNALSGPVSVNPVSFVSFTGYADSAPASHKASGVENSVALLGVLWLLVSVRRPI